LTVLFVGGASLEAESFLALLDFVK